MKLRQAEIQTTQYTIMKENPQKLDHFFSTNPLPTQQTNFKSIKAEKMEILIHTEETKKENNIVKSCNGKLEVYSKSTRLEGKKVQSS